MTVTTYVGVVHEGRIQLLKPVDLPEGSQVYIVVPNLHDERQAQRKASRWLMENVGMFVGPYHGKLVQEGDSPLWRFDAFVTARGLQPRGPIGHVDVDATTGDILTDTRSAEEMIQRGEHLTPALPLTAG